MVVDRTGLLQHIGGAVRRLSTAVADTYTAAARTIGRGTDTEIHADRAFRPSPFERAMQTVSPDYPTPLRPYRPNVFRSRTAGGAHSVYKPGEQERGPDDPTGPAIPFGEGQLAAREVATYRFDQAAGFGRVPPTGLARGPYGTGSNQLWENFSAPSYPAQKVVKIPDNTPDPERKALLRREFRRYPKFQREQMAVIDYVIANNDRHGANFLTDRDGGIVAIDNARSFPEKPDPDRGIRSDFVMEFIDKDLSEEVLRSVRAIDTEQLRRGWEDLGLSDEAIKGALDRSEEIRVDGKITGRVWTGAEWNGKITSIAFQGIP